MTVRTCLAVSALVLCGACSAQMTGSDSGDPRFLKELPEAVLNLAAPYQDLSAVVLREDDGCYWYRYNGPVETTFLPLRTVEGRPICTRRDA